jgi:hypothetical protein
MFLCYALVSYDHLRQQHMIFDMDISKSDFYCIHPLIYKLN